MAEQTIKCILCTYILAVVVGSPGKRALQNVDEARVKKLDDGGTAIICQKCWALTRVDHELLDS